MGRRRRDHRPQHAAVEGVPAAPGARRAGRDRRAATAATRLAVDTRCRRRARGSSTWPRPRPAARGAGRRGGGAGASRREALALFRGEVLVDAGDGDWLHRPPGPARGGPPRPARGPARGPGRPRRRRRRHRRARGPRRPTTRSARGCGRRSITALYRAGRQADALAAYARVRDGARRRARPRAGPGSAGARGPDPAAEPGARRHRRARRPASWRRPPGNLPALTSTAGRPGRRARRAAPRCSRATAWSPWSDRPGSARPGWRSRWRAGWSRPAARGWCGSTRPTPTRRWPRWWPRRCTCRAARPMLVERLAGADALLVLDNCEHVVDAVADLVDRLLDADPSLRVLATSQLPLGLDGETVFALEPLPIADSIGAVRRAGRGDPHAVRARRRTPRPIVEEVCRSLDGLPLAIELAAARVKSLSVQRDRPPARRPVRARCATRPAGGPERRRALAGAIAWSYDLLFPDDQRGLWALSCFAGGAPLAAAEHVLGALGVPRGVGGRRRRPAGRPVAGERRRSPMTAPSATGCSTASGPSPWTGCARPASTTTRLAAHAAWFADAADRCAATVRGARRSPSASPSPGPSGPTSMPPWRGAPSTTRRSASASPTASAGPGSCSATAWPARPGSAPRSSAAASTAAPRRGDRPAAGRVARSVGRRRGAGRGRPRRGLGIADELPTTSGSGADARAPPGLPAHPAGSPRRVARRRRAELSPSTGRSGLAWEEVGQPAARRVRLDHARRHGAGGGRR